jgi:hypothetical protein
MAKLINFDMNAPELKAIEENNKVICDRPVIRGQGFRFPHAVRPIVGSTYRVREWDETWETVVVVLRDESPLGDVVVKYVRDGLMHKVTEEYFVRQLSPTNITTTQDRGGRIMSWYDSDGNEHYE